MIVAHAHVNYDRVTHSSAHQPARRRNCSDEDRKAAWASENRWRADPITPDSSPWMSQSLAPPSRNGSTPSVQRSSRSGTHHPSQGWLHDAGNCTLFTFQSHLCQSVSFPHLPFSDLGIAQRVLLTEYHQNAWRRSKPPNICPPLR